MFLFREIPGIQVSPMAELRSGQGKESGWRREFLGGPAEVALENRKIILFYFFSEYSREGIVKEGCGL